MGSVTTRGFPALPCPCSRRVLGRRRRFRASFHRAATGQAVTARTKIIWAADLVAPPCRLKVLRHPEGRRDRAFHCVHACVEMPERPLSQPRIWKIQGVQMRRVRRISTPLTETPTHRHTGRHADARRRREGTNSASEKFTRWLPGSLRWRGAAGELTNRRGPPMRRDPRACADETLRTKRAGRSSAPNSSQIDRSVCNFVRDVTLSDDAFESKRTGACIFVSHTMWNSLGLSSVFISPSQCARRGDTDQLRDAAFMWRLW